jgi:toxin YhaV
MPVTLEVESTLTDRYQTTVPEMVRRSLRLGTGDKVHYSIRPNGDVLLSRAEVSETDDPVLAQFLGFLSRDMSKHPAQVQVLDAGFVQRLQSLTMGVEVDLDALAQQVSFLKETDPVGYVKKDTTKRLAAITKLAFDVIPQDPIRPEYRQGNTLGEEHKHWFRAKFLQQYRLFFRYHAPSKMIVLTWVNDEEAKRAYDSSEDAYRVFRKILESGHPPDDWSELLAAAKDHSLLPSSSGTRRRW